jgi:hypothetical protein
VTTKKTFTEKLMPERGEFSRREVAERRVEWLVRPPSPDAEGDEYDRYENDRLAVMHLIEDEFGGAQPQDLRVIEREEETAISYRIQRVVLK